MTNLGRACRRTYAHPGSWLVALIFLPQPVAAQDPKIVFPSEHKDTAARLAAADRLIAPAYPADALAGIIGLAATPRLDPLGSLCAFLGDRIGQQKWPEAIEEYQQLLYEDGDNLVPERSASSEPTACSVSVRRLCQARLATAPASVRVPFRQRADIQAEKWFREGARNRDPAPLRRLVNGLLDSSYGGRALDLLGDLAFERGDFAEAQEWWRALARLPAELAPGTNQAAVAAKQILATALAGDRARAEADLAIFPMLYPNARGTIGGQTGAYTAIVKDLLGKLPTTGGPDEPWPTFAGSVSRNRVVAQSPSPRAWADGPIWRVSLKENFKPATPPIAEGPFFQPARPGFFPVIVSDRVIVADADSVAAYHLLTGNLLFRHRLRAAGPTQPNPPGARFTLSAEDDCIYVRLGGSRPGAKAEASFLICLKMQENDGKVTVREVWRAATPGQAVFEGAPLVKDRRVYIALTEKVDQRVHTSIACHDAGGGALHWRQKVCDVPEATGSEGLIQRLLTVAGTNVVYCSDSGAIVAVDQQSGRPAWAVRYATGRPPDAGQAVAEPLAPCVFSNGLLFVAPRDTSRLFCLDAASGQLLWDRDGIEIVQLLGEARGRLIFTTPQGIRAVMSRSGLDHGGWIQPSSGKLPPLGRGILAGRWVFWPVRDVKLPLRAVLQATGDQEGADDGYEPTQLRQIRPGNLAFGNGCLVVAGNAELVAYVPPERFLPKLQAEAQEPGPSALTLCRLAEAEAGLGRFEPALEHFTHAARARFAGPALRCRALAGRHEMLLHLARAQQPQAQKLLDQAVADEFPPQLRLKAYRRLVEFWLRTGQPAQAVATWQAVLKDEHLRRSHMTAAAGLPQETASFVQACIQKLIDTEGPTVYEPFERQARERLARAAGKVAELERLVEEFPNASITMTVRKELARLRPVSAPTTAGPFTLPVARTWEAPAGRLLIAQPPAGAPDRDVAFFAGRQQIDCRRSSTGALVWSRKLDFTPVWIGERDETLLVAGLDGIQAVHLADGQRLWSFAYPTGTARPALGSFHLTENRLIFLCDRRRLIALDIDTGQAAWSHWADGALLRPRDGGEFSPRLVTGKACTLVQTTAGRRLAYDTATGKLLYDAPSSTAWAHDPVLVGDGSRVCIVEKDKAMLLEAGTGKPVWIYTPTWPTSLSGEPLQVRAHGEVLLVQVPRSYGNELERLDLRTGRPMWAPGPRVISLRPFGLQRGGLDDRALYVAADNALSCWSLADGKRQWQQRLPPHAGGWRARRVADAVLAYPERAVQPPWRWLPLGNMVLALPDRRLQETRTGTLSLSFHDPQTGLVQQRLDLHGPAAGLDVGLSGPCLLVGANSNITAYVGHRRSP